MEKSTSDKWKAYFKEINCSSKLTVTLRTSPPTTLQKGSFVGIDELSGIITLSTATSRNERVMFGLTDILIIQEEHS